MYLFRVPYLKREKRNPYRIIVIVSRSCGCILNIKYSGLRYFGIDTIKLLDGSFFFYIASSSAIYPTGRISLEHWFPKLNFKKTLNLINFILIYLSNKVKREQCDQPLALPLYSQKYYQLRLLYYCLAILFNRLLRWIL